MLPQPLHGTPPTEAFNLQQVITNVVSTQVKTMERRVLQAIEHPATYEDLLEEIEQPPFSQAIATPPCWPSSAHQLSPSLMECTALMEVPRLALTK
ncbi:hypothetical protein TIFTF001_025313 [Ficus carica]|uniref:Uncharacterized protein n=1 Tax=Ficus carica TaxID=3494 RepID=A0AA88AIQ6_FICCA|nr:hypothetical protein TIFTF001_025313 [Ficus carica]